MVALITAHIRVLITAQIRVLITTLQVLEPSTSIIHWDVIMIITAHDGEHGFAFMIHS